MKKRKLQVGDRVVVRYSDGFNAYDGKRGVVEKIDAVNMLRDLCFVRVRFTPDDDFWFRRKYLHRLIRQRIEIDSNAALRITVERLTKECHAANCMLNAALNEGLAECERLRTELTKTRLERDNLAFRIHYGEMAIVHMAAPTTRELLSSEDSLCRHSPGEMCLYCRE